MLSEETAIKKLIKIREDTIKANECGLSNNDFKEEIEVYDILLNLISKLKKENEKLKNKNKDLLRKLRNRVKEVKKLTKYSQYKKEFSRLNKQLRQKDKQVDLMAEYVFNKNKAQLIIEYGIENKEQLIKEFEKEAKEKGE